MILVIIRTQAIHVMLLNQQCALLYVMMALLLVPRHVMLENPTIAQVTAKPYLTDGFVQVVQQPNLQHARNLQDKSVLLMIYQRQQQQRVQLEPR